MAIRWKISGAVCVVVGLAFFLAQDRSWANCAARDLPSRPVAQRRLWSSALEDLSVRLSWGRCKIVIKQYDVDDVRLSILDAKGRRVKEIQAAGVENVGLIALSGRTPSELYVETRPTSNIHSLNRGYYFTQSPNVHTLMIAAGGTVDAAYHLPSGAVLLSVPSEIEYAGDLAHAGSVETVAIIEMREGRFHLANRQYPKPSERLAMEARQELLDVADEQGVGWEQGAMGYYANLQTIGRRKEARIWLRHHLTPDRWRRFRQLIPEIDKHVRSLPQVVWNHDRLLYTMKEYGELWPDR